MVSDSTTRDKQQGYLSRSSRGSWGHPVSSPIGHGRRKFLCVSRFTRRGKISSSPKSSENDRNDAWGANEESGTILIESRKSKEGFQFVSRGYPCGKAQIIGDRQPWIQ